MGVYIYILPILESNWIDNTTPYSKSWKVKGETRRRYSFDLMQSYNVGHELYHACQEKKNGAFTANVPLSNKNKWTWRKKKKSWYNKLSVFVYVNN